MSSAEFYLRRVLSLGGDLRSQSARILVANETLLHYTALRCIVPYCIAE